MMPFSRFSLLVSSLLLLNLVSSCASSPSGKSEVIAGQLPELTLDLINDGTEIKAAGALLMDQIEGMTRIMVPDDESDSVLVVTVHGYQSEGYEWVTGIRGLAGHYGSVYFFRYDWKRCPEEIARDLAAGIKSIMKQKSYRKVLVFGHSYGGLVLTFSAAELGKMDAELHVIAAPLSGFPSLLDHCNSLEYNQKGQIRYPEWNASIRVIQHRTVHAEDGAFRDLARDPQVVDLPFNNIQELPATMDGHRLGHNWSVTWVLDQYIGRPHRF